MMGKLLGLICLFVISILTQAQTGPAGVGNSTSNCLWLKANAGTSTTTAGAAISSWNDQSGNSNHVSQTTAVQQPLYQTSIINGMPAIQFDNNNTAGQNDFLSGADASSLDNTTGISIFTVTRPSGTGSARSIVAKRTNVGVNQAYMFFWFTSDYLYADVASNDNRFSTNPTTYAANNNYLLDLIYDGSLAAASRSKIYDAQTLRVTATETATSLIDYASPLIVGSTHVGDNRAFNGYIAEIIIFREALNNTRRIVVDNYLSSKYAITLAANDFYTGDNAANGERDYEVAGIGQQGSSDSHTQFDGSATGGLGITYNSGFENGDYIFIGHNLTTNANINTDVAVVSGGPIDYRWERIWYLDVTNTSTSISTNIVFDMSAGGFPSLSPAIPTNYKLLYRSVNSGNWTIVSTASSIAGDQITFSGVTFTGNTEDGFYTIATLNNSISMLPIELLGFNAVFNNNNVDITWATASETNNDYFTIERSKDGELWAEIATVDGAGNSNQILNYMDIDTSPLNGTSYYRLKQTDFDGKFSYSQIAVVHNNATSNTNITPFPNPSDGNSFNLEFTGFSDEEVLVVIRDIQGKQFYSKMYLVNDHATIVGVALEQSLPSGTYLITASSDESLVSKRITVK